MEIVIIEYENYRGRTEKRYQLMRRISCGLDHVYDCNLYTLKECLEIAKREKYKVLKVGTFWEIVE